MSTVFPGLSGREILLAEDHFGDSAGGVDLSVDERLLQGWGSEVQFVRIPEDPKKKKRSKSTSGFLRCLPESCGVSGNV
jgi:hypothetical protein